MVGISARIPGAVSTALLLLAPLAQAQVAPAWEATFDSQVSDVPTHVIARAGAIAVVGVSAPLSASADRIVTVLYDDAGAEIWSRVYSSGGGVDSAGVGMDVAGNVYVTGRDG